MTSLRSCKPTAFALCTLALLLTINGAAFASCGDSLAAMAAATAVHNPLHPALKAPSSPAVALSTDNSGVLTSIVGMWHTQFLVDGQPIQEAYQIWNLGGTEVHNPNVDPRSNNICLGTWAAVGPQTYTLTHRVWWYDTTGDFLGTIHLHETVTLSNRGAAHAGSFKLDFYDPNDNFVNEVVGQVSADRIPAN